MEVVLLSHTPEPLALIYAAFRQCYSAGFAGDMYQEISGAGQGVSPQKQAAFVAEVMASGHLSPLEHVSFSFAVSGVSRALTHQLVRHRIASFSQQSQRYVSGKEFSFVTPPRIAANPQALERFTACMAHIGEAYEELKALLEQNSGTTANEDARFVLPQAACSSIVFTMNCRSLINFFEQRCCNRAQWEIRAMANHMLRVCREVLPEIFLHAGAKCEKNRRCPEGKFCCGRYPVA